MTGDCFSHGESQSPWDCEEGGAVGHDSCGKGSDEPPQLSSSPSVRAVQPHRTIQLPSATQLFVIRPVNSRAQSLLSPAGEPLEDNGEATGFKSSDDSNSSSSNSGGSNSSRSSSSNSGGGSNSSNIDQDTARSGNGSNIECDTAEEVIVF